MQKNRPWQKRYFSLTWDHEIRTPMNAIMGMSRQLKKKKKDDPRWKTAWPVKRDYQCIRKPAGHYQRHNLTFQRSNPASLHWNGSASRIREVIEHCGQVVEYKLREKGLRFESFIASSMADVFIGDPYRLNQVLLNLLSNAIKFTEKGNISISCTLESQSENHQLVNIAVTDTGIGMTEEFMDSLFSKFSLGRWKYIKAFWRHRPSGMSINKQLDLKWWADKSRVDSKRVLERLSIFHCAWELAAPMTWLGRHPFW